MIRNERHCSAGAKRARGALHRVRIVDDRHPHLRARTIDVGVEKRICHPARDRIEWNSARRDVRTCQLPVADVARDEHRAFALRHHIIDLFPSFDSFHQLLQAIPAERVEERGFYEGPTEMRVGFSGELSDGVVIEIRKCRGNLFFNHALPDTERAIAQGTELLADFARGIPAQCAQRGDRRSHRVIFRAMCQRRLARRLGRAPSLRNGFRDAATLFCPRRGHVLRAPTT